MAKFYEVPIHWRNGSQTKGLAVGNNAAWNCCCGQILLVPHEGMYQIAPCPDCQRTFRIIRGQKPKFVDRVEETCQPQT